MIKLKKKTKEKILPFFKYIVLLIIIFTIFTLGLFKFIDILPNEYFIILTILLCLISLIISLLTINKKSPRKRILGTFLGLIYIILLVLLIIYELNTIDFLKKLGLKNYKTENYIVVTLSESSINEISALDNLVIGSLEIKSNGLKEAKIKLEKDITFKLKNYEDTPKLLEGLVNKEIEAALIEESMYAIIMEDNEELSSQFKIIYNFDVDVETTDITKTVDITNSPFNIFISGIDTYGKVSSVSRSDVNMLITVNPNTHQILITSIPRDYYVLLKNQNAYDKLTHAGIYGIEESVATVENLLDTKINYYVKVNFSSVINIVDALGGVTVYSPYNFTSIDGYRFKKGDNYVNGKKALSFVRERKSFSGGDRIRIENQARMVEALINKATSPSIIVKYSSLLDALSDAFMTNLDIDSITEFIKLQIDETPTWEITKYSLNGTDSMEYTHSFKSQKLYVMKPNMDTVETAKTKIKELLAS